MLHRINIPELAKALNLKTKKPKLGIKKVKACDLVDYNKSLLIRSASIARFKNI